MRQTLLAMAGILIAGAVTPGPNNFVVLRQAARLGWRGALPPIIGVVAGSLTLLFIVSAGAEAALSAAPRLGPAVTAVGCLYLVWLGARLLAARPPAAGEPATESATLPAGAWGLLVFQLVNPKAWLLVLTVTASAYGSLGPGRALPALAVLFVVIPTACLALWAWAGVALARSPRWPRMQIRFDRVMGALLVVSALLLLVESWR